MRQHCFKTESANLAFEKIAQSVLLNPDYIVQPRGWETQELLNVSICITNPYDRLITNPYRKASLGYLIGEWIWYERGTAKLDEISYYSKFWTKVCDDGINVTSCYGKRLYKEDYMNSSQWEAVKKILIRDKNSRRAILFLCKKEDIKLKTKDIPCTLSLHFLIRDDKLHLTTYMRSNDLVLGFTYDQAIFTIFQEKMLIELRETYPLLMMGTYTHVVSSLHVYEKHFSLLNNVIQSSDTESKIRMPQMNQSSDIPKLIRNEEILRKEINKPLLELNDPFCSWCQEHLIEFIDQKNNKKEGEFYEVVHT